MNAHAWLVLAAFGALLLAAALPLGRCLVAVMEGRLRFADPIEQPLYRLCGVRPEAEMGWLQYAFALLLFNALGVLAVYALQRLQQWLPLNPQGMANVTPDSAFNTAVSFATNTNWQGYSGEQTMSYLTQMLGLAVQNFLSAATGIVVVIALIRGLARHSAQGIGNAWVDLTRVTLWVLLPLSFLQRVDHRLPDSAGPEGRALPAAGRRRPAAQQPADLRPGRRGGPLRGHQGHRSAAGRRRPGLTRRLSCDNCFAPPRACSSC